MNELQKVIDKLGPWFHNIHLPDGTQTYPSHPLGDFPRFKWDEIAPHVPLDLKGWRVLDIGCNAGFYSVELAKRGAQVTGIDIDQLYLNQAQWVAAQFGLSERIKLYNRQIYELSRINEHYDLIWYMGVFYHLRYPFLSLDILSRITKRLMVFQTMTLPDIRQFNDIDNVELFERETLLQPGWPKMAFIEKCLANDPTNWWVPNHTAVVSMLRSCGFRIVAQPSHEIYVCEPGREQLPIEDMREKEYRAAVGLRTGNQFN